MTEPTLSVSKGVFVFKNGYTPRSKSKDRKSKVRLEKNIFEKELWFLSYTKLWNHIEKKIEALSEETFSSVLSNLIKFIKSSYEFSVSEIPTAVLLTGINMPDHSALFGTLTTEIRKNISPHCAILYSEQGSHLKNLIENMISQFVNVDNLSYDELSDSDDNTGKSVKRSQCTFSLLQSWYESKYQTGSPKKTRNLNNKRPLVVILPDFESFNDKILQDFVLIISSYIHILPFALIFGVATSTCALHKSLPYHVSSKISVQVFQSHTSVVYLNKILENIFLTSDCPFQMGERVFSLFTDQFLFYDLSVNGFIRNIKYAMLEHYSYGNAMALCNIEENVEKILNKFTDDDFKNVRQLRSFQSYFEKQNVQIRNKLTKDNVFLKKLLLEEIPLLYSYFKKFHIFLKCLYLLVSDLPKNPLGKQLRELYRIAIGQNITETEEFKKSFQLLGFQSKDELIVKLTNLRVLIKSENDSCDKIDSITGMIDSLVNELKSFDVDNQTEDNSGDEKRETTLTTAKSRRELKEKLLKMTNEAKPQNRYEKMRSKMLDSLKSIFEERLQNPKEFLFNDIFMFDDISIRNHIEGFQRGALHEALTNPQTYLQCDCCSLIDEYSIPKTMPDICIIYKLHLEGGKIINLYDLLQSFVAVVEPESSDEQKQIKPDIHARFTQAVAELEYLGFIKSSKRKTDHVTRLTWTA